MWPRLLRPSVLLFSIVLPFCLGAAYYPLEEQGNKARVPVPLVKKVTDHGNCSPHIATWNQWDGGVSGSILVKFADEPDSSSWTATMVFDRDVSTFSAPEGELSDTSGKVFKISPKSWNAVTKRGTARAVGVEIRWQRNTAVPVLRSLTVNGVPLTCSEATAEEEDNTVDNGSQPDSSEETGNAQGSPVEEEQQEQKPQTKPQLPPQASGGGQRGVFVSWPKKVMGLYVLLADDDHEGYESTAVWEPRLYPYQQKAANVLFFTFIHPITMDIPPSFKNLAATRGTNVDGAVPADTVILFAIGGYAYSSKIKPWPWLESKQAAEAMAERVAKWPEEYGCDGIDLDLEDGAGDTPKAGPNMIHFIRRLRELVPNMIISQPTYGFPQVKAEIHVINESWKNGQYQNLADAVGLMVYEGTNALNYIKNYATATSQWSGFPIQVDVPKNTILLGAKGSASPGTIATLTKAAMDNDYLGIMVWYASVRNGDGKGLQYHATWDTSEKAASQDAYSAAWTTFRRAS